MTLGAMNMMNVVIMAVVLKLAKLIWKLGVGDVDES